MATPFSPFVGRPAKQILKRRQSELPSDLIDWEAPEIPEQEKDRIIYEAHIKELIEEHEIDMLLNEQIFLVAHKVFAEELTKENMTKLEEERSKINLLLNQVRMFQDNMKENVERIDELDGEISSMKNTVAKLEEEKANLICEKNALFSETQEELESLKSLNSTLQQEKENWIKEKNALQLEIEDLNFRNNETTCELHHTFEMYTTKKTEAEDSKKKLDAVKNQLSYYKRKVKNQGIDED